MATSNPGSSESGNESGSTSLDNKRPKRTYKKSGPGESSCQVHSEHYEIDDFDVTRILMSARSLLVESKWAFEEISHLL